jgi:hypothetical protein
LNSAQSLQQKHTTDLPAQQLLKDGKLAPELLQMACHADAAEREKQSRFWKQHTPQSQPSVETMMLDSKAKDIDAAERPEVGPA